MRPYLKIASPTLEALHRFCRSVEVQRAQDIAEIAKLDRLTAPVRQLATNITAVGNVGAGEDDLISYTIPSGTLTRNGEYCEFEGAFTFAANGNNKRIRVKLGSTTLYDTTALALNNRAMSLHAIVIRTGAAAQTCMVKMLANDGVLAIASVAHTAATESLAASVVFKFTGEATADNDIIQKFMTVKWYPSNIENA